MNLPFDRLRDRLGRPVIKLESNPGREDRLRWQGSAEAIVPGDYDREGLNNEKDEYDEQFEGRTKKTETFGKRDY